jgi:hypothetical protein
MTALALMRLPAGETARSSAARVGLEGQDLLALPEAGNAGRSAAAASA